MSHCTALGAIAALAICVPATQASIHLWEWERGDPGSYGLNDNGGLFQSVDASFDSNTNMFTWNVTFGNAVTEGFTLAVNNGPNPKGHAGELALLYVDASNPADVIVTAYAYNGRNSNTSYRDGDGNTGGDQTPDVIMDANQRNDWIQSASVVDGLDGSRTISLVADVTDLVNHTPMYPDAVDPWYGLGFAEQLGLWMHPYRTFNATYGADGSIEALQASGEGYFDGRGFNTVPTPGALALGAGALLCGVRRRRA